MYKAYVKDKKLRLRKNPTYLTDGRLSIKKNNLCLVFNDDLMRKYYKENKYISNSINYCLYRIHKNTCSI